MIKTVIKLGLLLFVGIIAYNYFLGSPEEKDKSKEIIGNITDIGKAGVGLIKEEIDKFKEGKYDGALDKIGDFLNTAKDQVQDKGGKLMDQIESWEEKKGDWENEKERLKELFSTADRDEQEIIGKQIKEHNEQGEALEKEGEMIKEKVQEEVKE